MKFPRIYHLPGSPGATKDDKILKSTDHLQNMRVIMTEKLDGENTSFLRNHIHARSEESQHHASQSWIKGLHATIRHQIPEHYQIVGENLYAKHSIYYDKLNSFFYVFAVIDLNQKIFLSITDTIHVCKLLNLYYVPVIRIEKFDSLDLTVPLKSAFGNEIEGFVIRNVESFSIDQADMNIAKWVRKGHVQTDKHWKKTWTPNTLMSVS